eukprot:878334-Lingulodinium_polyedra.AAC.1
MGTRAAPMRPCTPRVLKRCARARADGAQQSRDFGLRALHEVRASHRSTRAPHPSLPRAQRGTDTDQHTTMLCSLWAYIMAGSVARVAPLAR